MYWPMFDLTAETRAKTSEPRRPAPGLDEGPHDQVAQTLKTRWTSPPWRKIGRDQPPDLAPEDRIEAVKGRAGGSTATRGRSSQILVEPEVGPARDPLARKTDAEATRTIVRAAGAGSGVPGPGEVADVLAVLAVDLPASARAASAARSASANRGSAGSLRRPRTPRGRAGRGPRRGPRPPSRRATRRRGRSRPRQQVVDEHLGRPSWGGCRSLATGRPPSVPSRRSTSPLLPASSRPLLLRGSVSARPTGRAVPASGGRTPRRRRGSPRAGSSAPGALEGVDVTRRRAGRAGCKGVRRRA